MAPPFLKAKLFSIKESLTINEFTSFKYKDPPAFYKLLKLKSS